MTDRITLRPCFPGAIVRFPGTPKRILKADGEAFTLPLNPFWTRRIKGGDVEVVNNKPNQEETNVNSQ